MKLHETAVSGQSTTACTLPGRHLRRLRERAGLSLRALAAELHYPHSYIGRVERHEQLPSEALADALDDYFSTCGLFADALAAAQEWLATKHNYNCRPLEAKCVRLQVFTSSLVPSLLQVEDYARAHFSLGLQQKELPDLDARVASRLTRQRLLDSPDPPQYWAVMDESALRHLASDQHIMARQLKHLLIAAEQPHINLQVLPFTEPFHPLMGGSLTLLTMENGATTALIESYRTSDAVDTPRLVVDLMHQFDVVRAQALTPSASLDLIRHYAAEGRAPDPPA
ncbi:helix-turn-helix transcriptional regulator [Streptomyces sp. HSW2009]|uniref:helix-turn-helix domain-containing protein n=1 Tax=Streptomyces sp. HSW2009 TaxID=3142890 RepID=UPI0032EC899F